ncbi:hypothetical protein MNEG_3108 [Monoraphidium neglectum]|uniref:Uncharacterized protein n=1 Tax=Monoraphidium neglectum TaxID=145388 RepID=A0A0D2MWL2_9CHLO|nr:hypothetical protein MNEG_3108 [Monoraphidium neglectum]KIZ04847.1 hypothetical protein MNEG_3108 [Monoraphidium neglectum]|eukprot:XP_013903866.1 hypothetical protein MNEG_3108 [Monoraphidium neglectum]
MARSFFAVSLAAAALLLLLAADAAAATSPSFDMMDSPASRQLLAAKKNKTASAAPKVKANVTAGAATPRKRFSRDSLVASDATWTASVAFNLAKATIQLVQPLVAAAEGGAIKIDAVSLVNLGQLLSQLAAAGTDLASKVTKIVADSANPIDE